MNDVAFEHMNNSMYGTKEDYNTSPFNMRVYPTVLYVWDLLLTVNYIVFGYGISWRCTYHLSDIKCPNQKILTETTRKQQQYKYK